MTRSEDLRRRAATPDYGQNADHVDAAPLHPRRRAFRPPHGQNPRKDLGRLERGEGRRKEAPEYPAGSDVAEEPEQGTGGGGPGCHSCWDRLGTSCARTSGKWT